MSRDRNAIRVAEALDILYAEALRRVRELRDSHPDMTGKQAADLIIETGHAER